ncbi:hypothetical protein ABD87_22965 [Lysinibacillus sphaericus]|uniref:S1 RNA-binding domain-containing protein n=1 Tax=Lysinibacillus sphaericus TaxID=1421 RepID=UPI0018CD8E0C|nr:S1 RNA-binding domain-containing protein [Lysinibacillus sphaericus]MBG9732289.1 hypothetical protein [Lysinibacillus sphaericus]
MTEQKQDELKTEPKHEEREIQSLLIEGFDESKIQQESTYDEGILSVIRAKQNAMVLKVEVFSFDTHEFEVDGKKHSVRVAVLTLPNDSKRSVKGILPFEFSDEPDKNRFRSLFGRTIHVMVENYERDEEGKLTFTGNRIKAKELAKDITFRKVEVGDIIPAVVQYVSDRFVFLDVGGVTTRLPMSELSYEWISNLQQKYKIGDHLKVKVLEMDKKERTMTVSAKAALENPWDFVPKHYRKNMEVVGRVTGVVDFGIFVNVEAGVDVLCRHLKHQTVVSGSTVLVRIETITTESERINGRIIDTFNM